jgi:hypothetical protein
MKPQLQIVGVYPIPQAEEPCHLIEIVLKGAIENFYMGAFTQEQKDEDIGNWQVAYDEHFLNDQGTADLNEDQYDKRPEGDSFRVVFFLHYIDLSKPLLTPFGSVQLPIEQPMPRRLGFIKYDPPD